VTDKAFDDFAGAGTDDAANRRMLGFLKDGRENPMTQTAASASAWSAAAATPSSAACTASPRVSTTATTGRRRLFLDAGEIPRVGADLGIAADRAYGDFVEMAKREARLKNGIEAVAIVTPNHMHYPAAPRIPEARHSRHLRQAADLDTGRCAQAGEGRPRPPTRCSC
jgi:hypothetical protein